MDRDARQDDTRNAPSKSSSLCRWFQPTSARQIRSHEELKKSLKKAFESAKAIVALEPHQEHGSGRGDLSIRGEVVGGKIVVDLSIAYSSGATGVLTANQIVHSAPEHPMEAFQEIDPAHANRRYIDKMKRNKDKKFDASMDHVRRNNELRSGI